MLNAPGRGWHAPSLFERHLELEPLKGRTRGLVRCIFHGPDSTPSLSVDLERELFHCFACGTGGGRARFAELVGLPVPHSVCRHEVPSIAVLASRQAWAHPGIVESYRRSDAVRRHLTFASRLRRMATRLHGHESAWDVLAEAARLDRLAFNLEAALDQATQDRRRKPRCIGDAKRPTQWGGSGSVARRAAPAEIRAAAVQGTGRDG